MNFDFNEIILSKIKEMEDNHIIEEKIKKRVEEIVSDAIRDSIDWDIRGALRNEIKKHIGNIAEGLKLNSYNSLIATTVKNLIEKELNEDLAKKVQSQIKDIMLIDDTPVKLSTIIECYKEVNYDDDEEYSFNVYESDEGSKYGLTYKKFRFEPESNYDNEEKWLIEFYKADDGYKISQVDYNGDNIYSYKAGINTLKKYDKFECLILKCMLNDIKIEIDMSGNDCEEELYQSRECDD
jgi:hypothetical protein